MPDDLKDRVLEIVSIAKECPENLQTLCFELLLRDYLEGKQRPAEAPAPAPSAATSSALPPGDPVLNPHSGDSPLSDQQDLRTVDLHIKARKFTEKFAITLDQINSLFYKDNGDIKSLYEDLKTTRMAEGQIRVTLLHALLAGIRTGEFVADGEAVRAEVQQRKSYDSTNFTKNFKNSANLFDGFESYEKGAQLRLSDDGKKELAELIKELAR